MGTALPKPVTSVVVKRVCGPLFRVGMAEMNGWRVSMEDAHVIFLRENWGFFGVFDGHGGDQCSQYIANRFVEELQAGPPSDDAALKALTLRLDKEFLDTKLPSGSTGTFVVVRPLAHLGERRFRLHVGNVGDSRILLACEDGTLIEGPGTDGALTTDHKPDLPTERARIERTGGTVEEAFSVCRVNGDLAVSRAFGDACYKETGGPGQEDHPVCADPEILTWSCRSTDFLMLVCDGISEGDFPNRQVVSLAAEELRRSRGRGQGHADPGKAAAAVCRHALRCGSKDNLSCMIVLFDELAPGEEAREHIELQAGPFNAPAHNGFRKAYGSIAEHVNLSLSEAVELRYATIRKRIARLEEELRDVPSDASGQPSAADEGEVELCMDRSDKSLAKRELEGLCQELKDFGVGPPNDFMEGSAKRRRWFETWVDARAESSISNGDRPLLSGIWPCRDGAGGSQMSPPEQLPALDGIQAEARHTRVQEDDRPRRTVSVAPMEELRLAVEAISTLTWNDKYKQVCGKKGLVLKEDTSDNTAEVNFSSPIGITAWLPRCALTEVADDVS